jgi:hypothetical protein
MKSAERAVAESVQVRQIADSGGVGMTEMSRPKSATQRRSEKRFVGKATGVR